MPPPNGSDCWCSSVRALRERLIAVLGPLGRSPFRPMTARRFAAWVLVGAALLVAMTAWMSVHGAGHPDYKSVESWKGTVAALLAGLLAFLLQARFRFIATVSALSRDCKELATRVRELESELGVFAFSPIEWEAEKWRLLGRWERLEAAIEGERCVVDEAALRQVTEGVGEVMEEDIPALRAPDDHGITWSHSLSDALDRVARDVRG